MNESMRKIYYYENILEFKQSTHSELNLNEVNNWQLCRCCLNCLNDEDECAVDFLKMCVLVEGRFLSVQEMLNTIAMIQKTDELQDLPFKICKQCMEKITNFYFFCIQVKKAESVLYSLSQNLGIGNKSNKPKVIAKPDKCMQETTSVAEETFNEEYQRNSSTSNDEVQIKNLLQETDNTNANEIEEHCEFVDSSTNETIKNKCKKSGIMSEEMIVEQINSNEAREINELDNLSDSNVIEPNAIEVEHVDDNMTENNHLEYDKSNLVSTSSSGDFPVEEERTAEEIYWTDDHEEMFDIECDTSTNTSNSDNNELVDIIRIESKKPQKRSSKNKRFKNFKHKQERVKKPLLENIKCGVCEKSFRLQRDLVFHVKKQHPNSKAFQCRDCGVYFSHTQSLSRHMNTHKTKLTKHTCEFCTKSFLRPEDLRRHIRVHTNERPYQCPLCEKAFKQRSELKQHENVHIKDKKYECEQCDRVWTCRNSLYLHKKMNHSDNSQIQFECLDCVKTFDIKRDLLIHEQQVHGIETFDKSAEE